MPYANGDDPALPANVKKLDPAGRSKWVKVFNGAFKGCRNPSSPGGARSVADCEGTAMKFANGAVKEFLGDICTGCGATIPDEAGHKAWHESFKCMDAPAQPVAVVEEPPPPLGGALSFAQADEYTRGQQIDDNVWDQRRRFEQVVRNIWDADADELSLEQKAASIEAAARELAKRIAAGPAAEKSLPERLKSFFGIGGERAAITKTEGGTEYKAGDYADVPDASAPSTWKLRLAEGSSGNITVAQVARAITALQPSGFRGNKVALGSAKATVVGKIGAAIGKISGATDAQQKSLRERLARVKDVMGAAIIAFTKDLKGEYRWLAAFSNKFQDREGEIFSEQAHKEFEEWVETTGDYPELRLWHVPGSRIGQADFIGYADGFQLASGVFDPGMEDVVRSLVAAKERLGVSHGYVYADEELQEGVYERYRSFEVSVLPDARAANTWTPFDAMQLTKEVGMVMATAKRSFLVEHLGEERTARLEQNLGEMRKQLEGSGVAWKDFTEVLTEGGGNGNGEEDEDRDKTPVPADSPPADPPADPPASDKPAEDPAGVLVGAIAGAVEKALSPLRAELAAITVQVKSLQVTDDEKIAAAIAGRVPGGNGLGKKASVSDGTLIDAKAANDKGVDPADDPVKLGVGDGPAAPYVKQLLGMTKVPQS